MEDASSYAEKRIITIPDEDTPAIEIPWPPPPAGADDEDDIYSSRYSSW